MALTARQPSTLPPNLSPRHLLDAELRRWRGLRGVPVARLAGLVDVGRDPFPVGGGSGRAGVRGRP